MEKAVTALFNQLLLLFSIMQGINAEPLTLFMELLYSGINDAIKKEGLSYELLLSFW